MENQTAKKCGCVKAACGCAGTSGERCICGDRCACAVACRCNGGCGCPTAK